MPGNLPNCVTYSYNLLLTSRIQGLKSIEIWVNIVFFKEQLVQLLSKRLMDVLKCSASDLLRD